jgi:3-oxoacyl-[acyl-carrier-protein] synthase-3
LDVYPPTLARATLGSLTSNTSSMPLADTDDPDAGFLDFLGEIDGSGGDYLCMPAGGSRRPASAETVRDRLQYVHQHGQQVARLRRRSSQTLRTGI